MDKDISRVKADFKSIPPQPNSEFRNNFWCWLAQKFQNKVEESFKARFYLTKIFTSSFVLQKTTVC